MPYGEKNYTISHAVKRDAEENARRERIPAAQE
jgi:hypothetical protein